MGKKITQQNETLLSRKPAFGIESWTLCYSLKKGNDVKTKDAGFPG